MRFWIPFMFDPLEQAVDIARAAEEFGYEGLGLADHVVVPETFASVHPSGEAPFTAATAFPTPSPPWPPWPPPPGPCAS